MSQNVIAVIVLIVLLVISTPLLGSYMAKVFTNKKATGDRFFKPVERLIYRITGVNPEGEQRWTTYAISVLAFSLVSVLVLYGMQRLQAHLLFNPDHLANVPAPLSFNTAVSFLTNTNWQNYAGEDTMTQFTQMAGLAVQNFVSAAAGIAVAVALIRGLTRNRSNTLGNFWVDLTRIVIRVLIPIAAIAAIILIAQGAVQNLHATHMITTVSGQSQGIPGGPVASQEVIKQLGTNGGGFMNANAAHPYENPTGLTNMLLNWLLLCIPFALAWTFGKMAKDRKQGYAVLGAMGGLFLIGALLVMPLEAHGNIHITQAHVSQAITATSPGGNMEGKEIRNGPILSALFNSSSTSTSTGSINSANDSYTSLGGGVILFNMMLGEISPGGTGSGLYGMLIMAMLAVFIAGLMVGRTPEYLGKKIQSAEMKLVVLYLLMVPFVILLFTAISVVMHSSLASIYNPGPHGLSEVTYAFTSASNNNGSAFAGLSGNTDWYNTTLGLCMLVGRFALMVPVLAIAGSLGRKQRVPASSGTFPTGSPLFALMLAGIAVIVVGLTYFPVLALGPIVEHLVGKF
jgi:potassium-transporting ATPase potassium-binding subunit